MLKVEIDQLLSQQKLTSISDIVHFVIQNVSKSINFDPLQQIHYRLIDLQKPKGLDSIMIEEVKTIAEAMLDQREYMIRNDIDKNINDHFEKVETIIQKNINANSRVSLAELDFFNYQNTKMQRQNRQYKQNRQSLMTTLHNKNIYTSQKHLRLDQKLQNLYNDQFSTNKQLKDQRKQMYQLKMNIMSLQKSISQKVSLQQTQRLMNRFQLQIFQKLNKEKVQWQKMQFKVMKNINKEMIQIRNQLKASSIYKQLTEGFDKIKVRQQKYQKKVKKTVQQNKNHSKIVGNILQKQGQCLTTLRQQISISIKKIESQTFQQIAQLQTFLQEISEKLNFFEKIQQLKNQTSKLNELNVRGAWSTEMKLKNSMVCWQKQITSNQNFKFQPNKTQILINQPGLYQFVLHMNTNSQKNTKINFIGFIMVSSQPNQKHQIKIQSKSSVDMSTKLIQIRQKSFVSVKVDQNQSHPGKAYLQIKKV